MNLRQHSNYSFCMLLHSSMARLNVESGCLQLLLGSSAMESFGGSTFIDCILAKIVAEASKKTEVEALALAPAGLVQCLFGTGPAQAWMVDIDIHCVITYALLVLNCYRWRS